MEAIAKKTVDGASVAAELGTDYTVTYYDKNNTDYVEWSDTNDVAESV